ncbi:universal stress protein [Amycolatopsis anabasis]|uniref:universal stress protein n=1 Tax=Amycolatopsis anabasis TaxID=1840409 RepID=UPI00131C5622|nr:universal stress protein [Amycolatopsis anabasis]
MSTSPSSPSSPIVVGVDGSEAALGAVRWAAVEARHRRCGLRLVHAIDDPALSFPAAMPLREEPRRFLRIRGARLLAAAREAAKEVAPELELETELSERSVTPVLLAAAESASLLVLGTWGLRPLGRALAGSVSIALAAHARCPVALIRPHVAEEAPPADGPVVVGVEDSPASAAAIPIAFEEASWRGGRLIALHCVNTPFLAAVFEETHVHLDQPALETQAREVLTDRLGDWPQRYPGVTVERLVTRGHPTEELLGMADRAQLLVVGSRGRGGLAGMLLGSTSQAVMSYALCPVIVARNPGDHGARA